MGLFTVFQVPGTLVEEGPPQERYNPAPLFDTESGDFVLNGAKQMICGSGYDAWVLWCKKILMTQRRAHLGYSPEIGIEAIEAFNQSDAKAVEAAFERTITEALLADPMGRTRYVRDFRFQWKADSLYVVCVAVGTNGNEALISAGFKNRV